MHQSHTREDLLFGELEQSDNCAEATTVRLRKANLYKDDQLCSKGNSVCAERIGSADGKQ